MFEIYKRDGLSKMFTKKKNLYNERGRTIESKGIRKFTLIASYDQ